MWKRRQQCTDCTCKQDTQVCRNECCSLDLVAQDGKEVAYHVWPWQTLLVNLTHSHCCPFLPCQEKLPLAASSYGLEMATRVNEFSISGRVCVLDIALIKIRM